MGPQQASAIKIECVVHCSGRMMRWYIQRFEVVVLIFNFRAFSDFKAQISKKSTDSFNGSGDRMQSAGHLPAPGQRNIDSFTAESGLQQ